MAKEVPNVLLEGVAVKDADEAGVEVGYSAKLVGRDHFQLDPKWPLLWQRYLKCYVFRKLYSCSANYAD